MWPNGYHVSDSESTYTAYAFDRAKMLAGDPTASGVRFPGQTNLLLPADVDGPRTPGSGDPGLFYTFKDSSFPDPGVPTDRIELFAFSPNFATPASSTFTSAGSFDVAPFTYTVCGFFNLSCIPQAGTAEKVDAVSEWPMQRLAYRRFGDHQALVGNFTVGGGSCIAGRGSPLVRAAQYGRRVEPVPGGDLRPGQWPEPIHGQHRPRRPGRPCARLLGLQQHGVPEYPLRDPCARRSRRNARCGTGDEGRRRLADEPRLTAGATTAR